MQAARKLFIGEKTRVFPAENIFSSFQPDSHAQFNAHPEFFELAHKFCKHNEQNNGGDIQRLWSFILNCKQIIGENIQGDFAELGVWKGNTAAILAYFAAKADRKVYLFDTFEGFSQNDIKGVDSDKSSDLFRDTSIDIAKEVIGENSIVCDFVKGYFQESILDFHRSNNYAIISLDCDLYEPMKAGLDFFYPLVSKGGIFFLHDYSSMVWSGAQLAVDEFCKANGEYIVLMPDKSGSAFLRKSR